MPSKLEGGSGVPGQFRLHNRTPTQKTQGLGMYLAGRTLTYGTQGPGLNSQSHTYNKLKSWCLEKPWGMGDGSLSGPVTSGSASQAEPPPPPVPEWTAVTEPAMPDT